MLSLTRQLGSRVSQGLFQASKRNASGGGGPGHIPPESMPMGKRQLEQLQNWIPSLAVFGAASFVGMCYFTEWRVTNEWIPFYSGKFKKDE